MNRYIELIGAMVAKIDENGYCPKAVWIDLIGEKIIITTSEIDLGETMIKIAEL